MPETLVSPSCASSELSLRTKWNGEASDGPMVMELDLDWVSLNLSRNLKLAAPPIAFFGLHSVGQPSV